MEAPNGPLTIAAGQSEHLALTVSAAGEITCGAQQNNPGLAALPGRVELSSDGFEAESFGTPLAFYRDVTAQPPPSGGCPVTWDTAPVPYSVMIPLSVSSRTVAGEYALNLQAGIGGKDGALVDLFPAVVPITVKAAQSPPPPVVPPPPVNPVTAFEAPPVENKTVNLVPLGGIVVIRPPAGSRKQIHKATQVPDGTRVNTKKGFVQVVSDRTGRGDGSVQSAIFWNDSFEVGYTRKATPGGRKRSKLPITELEVTSKCIRGARLSSSAGRAEVVSSARRKRRRRGLFGSGRGRFRTRGAFGAGTVRGTSWYTENRCDATLFEVFSGVVTVRDFGLGRSVQVRTGQGYIAGLHRDGEGDSG